MISCIIYLILSYSSKNFYDSLKRSLRSFKFRRPGTAHKLELPNVNIPNSNFHSQIFLRKKWLSRHKNLSDITLYVLVFKFAFVNYYNLIKDNSLQKVILFYLSFCAPQHTSSSSWLVSIVDYISSRLGCIPYMLGLRWSPAGPWIGIPCGNRFSLRLGVPPSSFQFYV